VNFWNGRIGEQAGRSSATVFKQIARRNNMVHGMGECDKCTVPD